MAFMKPISNRPLTNFLIWVLAILLSLGSACSQQFLNINLFKKSNKNSGSTAVFPVGGRVYPEGYFYAIVHIGQRSEPYYLDIDTGSDLTWVQCDAPCVNCVKGPHPPYKPSKSIVLCKDPFCAFVDHPPNYPCNNPTDQCDYEIQYADHGSSLGVLLTDYFRLKLTNNSDVRQSLTFGCGYDQEISGLTHSPFVDGILGLANGRSSILSQLNTMGITRNVVGHCFSSKGGGHLLLGDNYLPSGIVWVPMLPNSIGKYYTVGPAELLFAGQNVVKKSLSFIFDSGSTFTYLNKEAYKGIVSMIKSNVNSKNLKDAPEDKTLPICWKGTKRFKSINDVRSYFKPLGIRFKNSKNSMMELQPEHYLIVNEKGNVCLAVLDGSGADLGDFNILGDVSMQDRLVMYDNDKRQIGWISENCDKTPNGGLYDIAADLGISEDASDEL
ncbi:hypothetical protein V2J09_008848 [Rumex salicifolius]